jgi:DNA sulfur modification protein DndD
MLLEQIILKDFRCFCGEYSVDFSTDPIKNVTLIHAENGVGKTTILNAMLWCFYGLTTAKFEKKTDLINHDARSAGRDRAHVEVLFEHNQSRYRARRYTGSGVPSDRIFTIIRLDRGHSVTLPNPDTFINTVIPKTMASHFLFDGEHAELFTGEEKRSSIRKAVQDILGCSLIDTAIKDLEVASSHYRRQMPKTKAGASIEVLSSQIDQLGIQIVEAKAVLADLQEQAEVINTQISDIDEKLRNSSAANQLQLRREATERELRSAKKRENEAHDEALKWLGDNGRFLVSTKLTDQTFDHLTTQETKGRLPSPYNEEFVNDLLDIRRCICGTELHPGSDEYTKVASLLEKAANHTLRSRLNAIRAVISQLKTERDRAPGRLDAANKRHAEGRAAVSRLEAELGEISQSLAGINFSEIADREKRRSQLKAELAQKHQQIGSVSRGIEASQADKQSKERTLKSQAETDDEARIFVKRYNICEVLKQRLERELEEEERAARTALRASIVKVLNQTGRKNFRLSMTSEYGISLINDSGNQLAKSGGENQLLGLVFTAALVEFAKLRQNAQDHRLLKGTVAPLVLDSPFGQLDESYGLEIAKHVPEMAGQVILMLSSKQSSGGIAEVLNGRIGKEYVLIRNNRDPRGDRPTEFRQFNGRDVETAVFDAGFDGSSILELA